MKLHVCKNLYVDGERVRMFTGKSDKWIEDWAKMFCPYARTIEVRTLRDVGRLPQPSKQPHNELFANYGSYKVNPYASIN